MRKRYLVALWGLVVLSATPTVLAVKTGDFKTCQQSSFCRRNRGFADAIRQTVRPVLTEARQESQPIASPSLYALQPNSAELLNGVFHANVIHKQWGVPLQLTVDLLASGMARVRLTEKSPLHPRYNGLNQFVLLPNVAEDNDLGAKLKVLSSDQGEVYEVEFGRQTDEQGQTFYHVVQITAQPLRLAFVRRTPITKKSTDGEWEDTVIMEVNGDGFLNYEHYRSKEADQALVDEIQALDEFSALKPLADTEGRWEERFKEWNDSKPHGPASVGVDVSFPGFSHVYGIPEHSSGFSLPTTRGTNAHYAEPYRLYNLDVFEYILDSPMALYGSIPFMLAHRPQASAGFFWLNAAETWVDLEKFKDTTKPSLKSRLKKWLSFNQQVEDEEAPLVTTSTHWMSESGSLDFFVIFGDLTPAAVLRQYGQLTGTTALPPAFSVAYHQCRWNYNSQDDVLSVHAKFDEYDIPYDVIWLDIEHTNDKRYFTWEPTQFSDPLGMQNTLAQTHRKLVTIVDPHIKSDSGYYVSKEGKEFGYFIKNPDGSTDFQGWCWPGNSQWVDYNNPAAVEWWVNKFRSDQYKGSSANLFVWNDMNEPSVFSGPEITLIKDSMHHGDWEHRDLHNVLGMMFHNATTEGVRQRQVPLDMDKQKYPVNKYQQRPFVLSRAYFAGTQRISAVWTGDNTASWSHLEASVPMILSNTIAGLHFIGADVGGFFGKPDPELLTRWYQIGAFQPFYRAHAHIDSPRREPWLFGEPYTTMIRQAIRTRYQLLPYIYTLFYQAYADNAPVMRPMMFEFPLDPVVLDMDNQAMLGSAILYKPIAQPGETSTQVYFPPTSPWFNFFTHEGVDVPKSGWVQVAAPLDTIPAFIRGGHIIAQRLRSRRSSELMRFDPLTLVIALDDDQQAVGELYLDDGESYAFTFGHFIHHQLTFYNDGRLVSTRVNTTLEGDFLQISDEQRQMFRLLKQVQVERIKVLGLTQSVTKVTIQSNTARNSVALQSKHECSLQPGNTYSCTVEKPQCQLANNWALVFHFA
ncbi:glucosidase II [Dispira simplex]|nr:glucosidase II [Dispira simplex]